MCPKLAFHRSLKKTKNHSTSYELMLCRTVGNSWSFLFLHWPPISILMISSILFYLTLPWIITYAPLWCLYLENVDDIKSDDDLRAKSSLPLTAIFLYMGTVGVSAFSDQSQCVTRLREISVRLEQAWMWHLIVSEACSLGVMVLSVVWSCLLLVLKDWV